MGVIDEFKTPFSNSPFIKSQIESTKSRKNYLLNKGTPQSDSTGVSTDAVDVFYTILWIVKQSFESFWIRSNKKYSFEALSTQEPRAIR